MNTAQSFEKWLQSEKEKIMPDVHEKAIRHHFDMLEMFGFQVWQAAMRQSVPDTHVLIPREPEWETICAMQEAPRTARDVYLAIVGQAKEPTL